VLLAGQTFARYVIEAPIGEGGMGAVYRAYDGKLHRRVALKVLHPNLAIPDAAARFAREARAAAALSHPNTIAIFDLGEIDGRVYLVMELVEGASLRAYVGDASVPIAKRLHWLVDMARGISAAHKAGLVHRDIKPANVMISNEDIVKVLDFGLAKAVEAASLNTDVGMIAGTPGYMAPELFTGLAADAKSDQFSFGVTAYELLSGGVRPPSPIGALPADPLDAIAPEVGPSVARIVARMLSRSPDDRFLTMNDVAIALERELGPTGVASDDSAVSTKREVPRASSVSGIEFAPTAVGPSVPTLAAHLKPRQRSPFATAAAIIATVAFSAAAAKFYVFAGDTSNLPVFASAPEDASGPLYLDADADFDDDTPDADDALWELPTFDAALDLDGADAPDAGAKADASADADAGGRAETNAAAGSGVLPGSFENQR